MKKIDLSIIIVSFNTQQLLDECLASLYTSLSGCLFTFEVIVVDNASTDGSLELLSKKYSKVRVIANTSNQGFGRANNQGIQASFGEYILLLNSDIVVQNAAISKLFHYTKTLPINSLVGGKLFNTDGSPQASCGGAYTLLNIFIALFLKGDYTGLTRSSPDTIREVDWVMGACMLTSRSFYDTVGWFDEGIFMYMEEIDLQYRAQKKGYKIFFYPEAHFIHVGAASSSGRATPILNVFRGFKFYYKKHYGPVQNFFLKVLLVIKSVIACVVFWVLGKEYEQKMYSDALKIALS